MVIGDELTQEINLTLSAYNWPVTTQGPWVTAGGPPVTAQLFPRAWWEVLS